MTKNKKGIKVTNPNGKTVNQTDDDRVVRRKHKKGEIMHIGENIIIQNSGNVGL